MLLRETTSVVFSSACFHCIISRSRRIYRVVQIPGNGYAWFGLKGHLCTVFSASDAGKKVVVVVVFLLIVVFSCFSVSPVSAAIFGIHKKYDYSSQNALKVFFMNQIIVEGLRITNSFHIPGELRRCYTNRRTGREEDANYV